jgi:hypothetical protein
MILIFALKGGKNMINTTKGLNELNHWLLLPNGRCT